MNKPLKPQNPEAATPSVLLRKLPPIRRARNWRLYGTNGKRYIDLYADAGRAIMGYSRGRGARETKDLLDKGLVAAYPSTQKTRFEKALAKRFPGYARFWFFPGEADILLFLASFTDSHCQAAGMRPALRIEEAFGGFRTDICEDPSSLAFGGEIALCRLPCQAPWSFGIMMVRPGAACDAIEAGMSGKENEIPPVKLVASARSLDDLNSFEQWYGEAYWSLADSFMEGLFRRSGPWLYPLYEAARHPQVFMRCLGNGILISPDWEQPSLVPGEFDKGELLPLAKIAKDMKEEEAQPAEG
ncbi:MAG: hypothetical protein LLF89_00855 [Spirochaetaceae bacterium]|nr:hypothetical protein [Spirochaetaceae bacterium]